MGNTSDPYLTGLVALDKERAILNDDETVRLISSDAQILGKLDLPLMGFTERVWIGDTSYLSTNDGYCPFDPDTLQCGEPLEGFVGPCVQQPAGPHPGHKGGSCRNTTRAPEA